MGVNPTLSSPRYPSSESAQMLAQSAGAIALSFGVSSYAFTQDLSFGEVGNFTGNAEVHVFSMIESPPAELPEVGSIVPALPPGFELADVAWIARQADITSTITNNMLFLPAGGVVALVEFSNGNYGVIQDLILKWNGSSPQDFTNAVLIFDMYQVTGGSARFQPQLVPSLDPEEDFTEVRVLLGNPGPYVGARLPLGYVLDRPPFGVTDSPLRGWRLDALGTLAPGEQLKVKIAFDLGVPAENTATGLGISVLPLDRTTSSSPVTLTFEDVLTQGQTLLTTSSTGPAVPAGFQLGDPPTYYDIETTATFNGEIQICIDYSGVEYESELALVLLHSSDGVNWDDITQSIDTETDTICGTMTSFSVFAVVEAVPDFDGDGLTDDVELTLGTDFMNPDTDGDGLFDGTEVLLAMHGCPSPLDSDSDGDSLLDGAEISLGTDPCNSDSDADGVPDGVDPLPTIPGVTTSYLEARIRVLSVALGLFDVSHFEGANDNARAGRRNALANLVRNAANHLAGEDGQAARAHLELVQRRVDGLSPPEDWILPSAERLAVHTELTLLLHLLNI